MPTRARTEKIQRVFECIRSTVEHINLVDVWLYVDDDDEATLQYIKSEEWRQYEINISWYIGKPTKSMGDMLNQLWQRCSTNPGIYLPFCDDNTIETPHWDAILRDFMAKHQDGIMLGYLIDPEHASYQVTIPVPSAQWLNNLGYLITSRFYFWFDDKWLDQIAEMTQRKVLIPIRLQSQNGKGSTQRMKNLHFWNQYFACTVDDRFDDAKKILEVIHKNDSLSLELALQIARQAAAIHIHKSIQNNLDADMKTELVVSDPEYIPSASKLINYLEIELYAAEDIIHKMSKAINRSNFSDTLYLLSVLECSSYNIKDINYIKSVLFKDGGNISSAAKCLLQHIDNNPNDLKSAPLVNKLNEMLPVSCSMNNTSTYLSDCLGITDDYFIFFPSKIDEELYFIIQGLIYDVLHNGERFNSILVVGAGNGEGAVHAIVSAYRDANSNILYCIEPNEDDFAKLDSSYSHVASLYNCSSVSTSNYISENELSVFYNYIPSVMSKFPLESFISALTGEKQYLDTSNRSCDCIRDIKRSHNLDGFDFVVLNGSLFSGKADLDAVYGSNFILLTSIKSIKDAANHKRLSDDNNYELLFSNSVTRAGYSMFKWKGVR
jgi:tetratricopeptide (TPR) repeat protein